MTTAVIGLQYGDEGKGRVVGELARNHRFNTSVRFNGGPNAGHTVYRDGECFKLHHLPCGIVYGNTVVLDAGMVVDIEKLEQEIKETTAQLAKIGQEMPEIWMSENVHLITMAHKTADADGSNIGSTKSGIAYVHADRALRKGIRASSEAQRLSLMGVKLFKGCPPLPYGETILEGAQGLMLDIDYGAYPYVSSGSVMPSYRYTVNKIYGVMKAYLTRVGDGPPYWKDEPQLRDLGQEFGTTTGRARKCCWLDVDEAHYAIDIVKPHSIIVTKLDILKDQTIWVYKNTNMRCIGTLDDYKEFLVKEFPQIKAFSEAPEGELIWL